MSPLQLHVLGTGTSTCLPITACLTLTEPYPPSVQATIPSQSLGNSWPSNIPCMSCRSAVDSSVPEGWKNKRGNTSVVLRKNGKTVVVDVGKSFREQASMLFPKWGIKNIDAVILTHGHADAFHGLDDLREWCVRQGTPIPIFLNRPTYDTVAKAFPYLVDVTQASGGGDVPSLEWHIIEDDAAFVIHDIHVQSLPVHHGVYFTPPNATPTDSPHPLICLGFAFDHDIVYISDVSSIPASTWDLILSPPTSSATVYPTMPHHSLPTPARTPPPTSHPLPPKILIIDALWPIRTHASHINFPQALEIAMRIKPQITYLIGFSHPTTHYMWEKLGRSVAGRGEDKSSPSHPDEKHALELVEKVWADEQFTRDGLDARLREWKGRVEPGWDGLVVEVDEKGWREGGH
ncbi:phosphoribosyl 1,2-cyclic phosphate phosphodiesterase, partial [Tremellales sp. Uapishka_1]